jgi:hypothetical protein
MTMITNSSSVPGALPLGVRERLATLTADELTALADALLDFTSLAEVEAWLAVSPPEQT